MVVAEKSAVVESSAAAFVAAGAAVEFAVAVEGQPQNWAAARFPYWAFLVSLG